MRTVYINVVKTEYTVSFPPVQTSSLFAIFVLPGTLYKYIHPSCVCMFLRVCGQIHDPMGDMFHSNQNNMSLIEG